MLLFFRSSNRFCSREFFDKEHELLSRLNHPNLVRFFGCTLKQHYALIEHSHLGDVHTFLSSTSLHTHDQTTLSYVHFIDEKLLVLLSHSLFSLNIRLFLVTQLSNALSYLESENIVHRDIAARNCLLYPNYEMKLTHTAMASKEFPLHYYTIDHCRLPIRWMAPETIAHVNTHLAPSFILFFSRKFSRMNLLFNRMFGPSVSLYGKS